MDGSVSSPNSKHAHFSRQTHGYRTKKHTRARPHLKRRHTHTLTMKHERHLQMQPRCKHRKRACLNLQKPLFLYTFFHPIINPETNCPISSAPLRIHTVYYSAREALQRERRPQWPRSSQASTIQSPPLDNELNVILITSHGDIHSFYQGHGRAGYYKAVLFA